MSDPAQLPEKSPAPKPTQPGINWHRVRVYLWSILLVISLWISAIVITVRENPAHYVNQLMAMQPYSYSTGNIYWLNRRTLKIEYVKIGGFFYADSIIITASPWGLLRHHIAKVEVMGGQLFTKPLFEEMDRTKASHAGGLDWVIGRLELSRGTVMLQNLVENTSIPVRLGVTRPIVLNGLRLGEPDSSPEMKIERSVEIGTVNIVSPVDPVTPVFHFPLTRIRYTYSEIWRHHIREIDFVRPTLYLGEDLFWLTEKLKFDSTKISNPGLAAPWQVGHLEVQFGQLAVNAFGQPVVQLPFFFGTKVDDIRLDQLDKISAKSTVPIERLDQDYPDYKIRLVNLTGQLYFSWPPTDEKANNVVTDISIEEISWNEIPVTEISPGVTFDPNGVYGTLFGKCEGGYLSGNFEFYYTKGFTWNADFFAKQINCQPIAEKLAGKYIDLTGELDGKISVQGKATEILNCSGSLDLPTPGKLEIKSMSELMNRLPSDMIALKKDALKLAIESFRTYPYDHGQLKVDYKPTGGLSTLTLNGPRGARNFSIYLHPWSLTDTATDGH